MADYIEKEAAKEAILSWAVCINHPELLSKEDALHCIDYLPAADVAEVRHGKIIETIKDGKMNRVFSRCGHDFTELTCWYMPKYCPNCGALMKEDEHGSEFD